MNNEYIYEYAAKLERVLSFAYAHKYSLRAIERAIAYSPYFQAIESDHRGFAPIIDDSSLLRNVFGETSYDGVTTYNQCVWAAEAYMRIQSETRLTFEAIFIYLPIDKMYEYFPLFHEMDFSHIVAEFNRLMDSSSLLDILLTRFGYTLKSVSEETGIPYDTLFSIKKRRRDIKKINAESACALASLFRVRVETLVRFQLEQ